MDDAAIPVPLWPDAAPPPDARLIVIGLPTAPDAPRERTRLQVRRVLREVLAARLSLRFDNVPLQTTPGRAPRLAAPFAHIGLSFAHEAGLSLLAISFDGAVGVDLTPLSAVPQDWPGVARDYFGPAIAERLLRIADDGAVAAFAAEWSAMEARRKCAGMALVEWQGNASLPPTSTSPLALPPGWVGSLARPFSAA
ncbi:4'-phosphopantetheinyl transferase superfamily protein [Niveibacterium umoris]|uniref:4'-phosphopantetheinyl transferase n=1 Tax=Niveibacterium umoris TaxID=1193620 RepID=A0A840BLD8_9RHOO|nr:4-phosphopantetheinyl transferase [Niveibacterium umoris]MBB4013433.1 4'-phosphopantetheinyl transferase [Niveibacterium umoris]